MTVSKDHMHTKSSRAPQASLPSSKALKQCSVGSFKYLSARSTSNNVIGQEKNTRYVISSVAQSTINTRFHTTTGSRTRKTGTESRSGALRCKTPTHAQLHHSEKDQWRLRSRLTNRHMRDYRRKDLVIPRNLIRSRREIRMGLGIIHMLTQGGCYNRRQHKIHERNMPFMTRSPHHHTNINSITHRNMSASQSSVITGNMVQQTVSTPLSQSAPWSYRMRQPKRPATRWPQLRLPVTRTMRKLRPWYHSRAPC
ncbi:hypothetical protein B0O80DRAFT_432136 [Mortierella sp. GBAus27b]|nr:hypothetical protein B0O80DRAFT_432136 [Mortierella sp. GBAus27b]